MAKRKTLLPWWLWLGCLVGIVLGLWMVRYGGASQLAAVTGGVHAGKPQALRRLAALPTVAKPAMLLHLTVRKLQLFDGNRLIAEYDIHPDHDLPKPGRAVVNRLVSEGEHAPFVLLTDGGAQPQVSAVLHAAPLPAGVNLPGVSVDELQLYQLIGAMSAGAPVTILP